MQKETTNSEKKIVMAFGTFDYFHAGHEFFLKKAKALGDELIVIIARDKTVKQIKGKNPSSSEKQRLKRIKESELANKVILGNHGNKYKVIKKHRPHIIALGYDQFVFTQKLKKTIIDLNLNTTISRIDAHFPQVYKSSLIKEKYNNEVALPVNMSPNKI